MKKLLILMCLLCAFVLTPEIMADNVRNDMPRICKKEAKRYFSLPSRSIRIHAVERENNRFVIYGQSPKNSNRALYFKCTFDRRGNYTGIRKTKDTRYGHGREGNHQGIPKTVRRVCKGEAAARWRMNHHDIRIDRVRRQDRYTYRVDVSARHYRGRCEVSKSGHVYRFKTQYRNAGNVLPYNARQACKREAAWRWGIHPNQIRTNYSRRIGRDDYIVTLSSRYDRAECEVSSRGWVYQFSEY